jgi:hypothetical protein
MPDKLGKSPVQRSISGAGRTGRPGSRSWGRYPGRNTKPDGQRQRRCHQERPSRHNHSAIPR